jgi:hypothetical protein
LFLDLLIYMQEIQYTGNLVIHTQFIMCHLSYTLLSFNYFIVFSFWQGYQRGQHTS